MFNVLTNIFLVLLIVITALGIVFVLSLIVMVVSVVKREIRKNNEDRGQ